MANPDKSKTPFSIKDIDVDQLTQALSEHQNTVIKLALMIGVLLLVVVMFNDHHNKAWEMQTRISQVKTKLEAIKGHDAAIQDLKDFTSSLPKKLNEIELITLISDYAKSGHIIIVSLNPTESRDMGLYDLIDVNFTAESNDFKSMMLFLRKIERSTYPLRLDSWSGHEEEGGKIIFSIEINAVLIHQ
jgi:hypothetical protein